MKKDIQSLTEFWQIFKKVFILIVIHIPAYLSVCRKYDNELSVEDRHACV